jgi:phospholipid/cholesterol/gamma-HCH transport system substrate-binding protein
MRERGLEFKVGLLILVSSAILVAFIFVLGNFSLRSGFTLALDYDYIGSLQKGAPVKVSGIKVGKVEDVEFFGGKIDPTLNQRVQVRVTVWVENRVKDAIRSDAEFFINTAGVLGEQYLEIVPGKDWDKPGIAPGTVVHDARVKNPPRTDLVVARLYEVLDGVSSVLRDDRDAIKHLLSNGANAVAEVNTGLGDGRPLASVIANADRTLVQARSSLATLTPGAAALMSDATRVTGLLTEQRLAGIDKAVDNAGAAAGRAGALLDNANGMVTDLRAGKGSVGSLLSRDELYSDLRELIRDLKRNPWKLFWKE